MFHCFLLPDERVRIIEELIGVSCSYGYGMVLSLQSLASNPPFRIHLHILRQHQRHQSHAAMHGHAIGSAYGPQNELKQVQVGYYVLWATMSETRVLVAFTADNESCMTCWAGFPFRCSHRKHSGRSNNTTSRLRIHNLSSLSSTSLFGMNIIW